MRRKMIQQEAFDRLSSRNVDRTRAELEGVERPLSRVSGMDVKLESFDGSGVLYRTSRGTHIHASHRLQEGRVVLEGLTELVIDESSRTARRRELIGKLIDHLTEGDTARADVVFGDLLDASTFSEAKKFTLKSKKDHEDENDDDFEIAEKKDKKKNPGKIPEKQSLGDKLKAKKSRDKTKEERSGSKGLKFEKDREKFKKAASAAGKNFSEALRVAYDVQDYVDYMVHGPVLAESLQQRDDADNLVSVSFPDARTRTEGRILNSGWKNVQGACKTLRTEARSLCDNDAFVHGAVDCKHKANSDDGEGLDESLSALANACPEVLHLTRSETAKAISEALSIAGQRNYDDATCDFLAEGLLRRASDLQENRARKMLTLAGVNSSGDVAYESFEATMSEFLPEVDRRITVETKVFEDLYGVTREFYDAARRRGYRAVSEQTAGVLSDLSEVLSGEVKPTLELAASTAGWLENFVEANVPGGGGEWSVTNIPHVSPDGNHPKMASLAKVPAIPGIHDGDYEDASPQVDMEGKWTAAASKDARSNSWGNIDGLKPNPYVPEPFGKYTMRGEDGIDKNPEGQFHSTWTSGDTFPQLKNPYVPGEAGGEGGQGYKMKNGAETDLVVAKGVNKK